MYVESSVLTTPKYMQLCYLEMHDETNDKSQVISYVEKHARSNQNLSFNMVMDMLVNCLTYLCLSRKAYGVYHPKGVRTCGVML